MANVTYTALYTQLNIDLRDTDDFAFEPAEKAEALRSAIEDDPNVYVFTEDTSNVVVAGQRAYDTPFDETLEVAVDYLNDGFPTAITRGLWEQIDGQIVLDSFAKDLPAGATITLTGLSSLSKSSGIPESFRAYIVANAVAKCADLVIQGKVTRFAKNDTSMSEMQMLRSNKLQEAANLRRKLRNRRIVRF